MILLCSTVPSMFSKSHLECSGQGLITPPVRGQLGAEDVGGPGLDKLPGVLGQDLRHLPLRPPPLRRVHAAPLLISCKDNGYFHTDIIDNFASLYNPLEYTSDI